MYIEEVFAGTKNFWGFEEERAKLSNAGGKVTEISKFLDDNFLIPNNFSLLISLVEMTLLLCNLELAQRCCWMFKNKSYQLDWTPK